MAHVAKFTKGAMGHMLEHYDRSKKKLGENVHTDRTYLNYNLAEHQPMKQLDFIHKRLSEVKLQNRKDVNVLCDWVVTIPKDFLEKYPDRERDFFEATYQFLENKYGKENVVSAYVHRDEATPHLHFAFIPVVPDKKKGGYKVSAKEAITRNDLKNFHPRLSEHLQQVLNVQVNVLNDATKEGNKSIEELKRNTAQAEIEKLKNQLNNAKNELSAVENQIKDNKDYMSIYDKIKVDVIKYKELPNIVSSIVGNNKVLVDRSKIEAVNKQLKGLLTKDLVYSDVLHKAHSEAARIVAEAGEKGKAEALAKADKIFSQNKKDIDVYAMSKMQTIAEREYQLDSTINSLNAEMNKLKIENKSLKKELSVLRPVVSELNELRDRFSRLVEVTKARELSDQQKNYINNGNVNRNVNKGIEL